MAHNDISLSRMLRESDLEATTSSSRWHERETWLASGSVRSSSEGEGYYHQAQDCEVHVHDDMPVESNTLVDGRCEEEGQAYSRYRSSPTAGSMGVCSAAELLRDKLKVNAVQKDVGNGLRMLTH